MKQNTSRSMYNTSQRRIADKIYNIRKTQKKYDQIIRTSTDEKKIRTTIHKYIIADIRIKALNKFIKNKFKKKKKY